jgi:hypothetical protein
MADAAGLFTASARASSPTMQRKEAAAGPRRTKLYTYDSVAAQVFNPYGSSVFTKLSPKEIWTAAAAGNKKAKFHTELAADKEHGGDYRVGVGMSRMAETLLAAIEQLDDENIGLLLAPGPLQSAQAEGKALAPALRILNAGKGAENDETAASFSAFKKHKGNAGSSSKDTGRPASSTTADIEKAAAEYHDWLSKETTPLRAVLAILAGNGTFFAAHVAEKTSRAWALHKPADKSAAQAAALARARPQAPSTATNSKDTEGLFA